MALGRQGKALLLLICESSVQVLSWQQGKLTELALLGNEPEDQQAFTDLIRQYPALPLIIVTDLIDENFRHDTIVHVGGSDRAALLKRKLEFAFRNTRYRIATVTGRRTDGRKDDKILLSAINKPERIDLWAKLLLQEGMAVQSVTSIAHLLGYWLPLEKLDQEEHLLVTTLDSDNYLRQSFVSKGKVQFSRLASLSTVPERRLGVEILQETTQLRQYLERIQFIAYDKPLKIVVLANIPDEQLHLEAFSSETNLFEVIDISTRLEEEEVLLQDQDLQPAHYLLARVLGNRNIDNVYAPPSLTRFSDLRKFGRLLLGTAAVLLIVGLGLNIPGLLTLQERWDQADNFMVRTVPLRRDYQNFLQRFPTTAIPPREMELVVRTHDLLAAKDYSPVDELNLVAAALARSPGLLLTGIEWALVETPFEAIPDQYGGLPEKPAPMDGIVTENLITGLILQDRVSIRMLINGEAYSPSSYRDAQEQVLAFAAALSAHGGIQVNTTQMPINVRTDTNVTTTINDSEVRSPFALELLVDKNWAAATVAGANQP